MTVSTELELESIMILSPREKLENSLRKLLDDERFFDISLKCSDNVILNACKNILASRSEVFNDHIFDEKCDKLKKRTSQQQQLLEFDKINSVAMKYILEYLFTSKNEREKLKTNNVVEIYYSSIYFNLDELQKKVIEFTDKILREGDDELGKELLSNFVEKFSLEADNKMGDLLVDWVAKMQLFPHKANEDLLSLMGLQYLLTKTYSTKKSFGTYELTLFEYTIVKTKNIVLEEDISSKKDPYDMNYESSVVEKIRDRLTPLLPYINLCIIYPDDVICKLEPLKVFPPKMIMDAYRHGVEKKDEAVQPIRGRLIFKWKHFSKEQSENKLYVIDNGFTVRADSNLKKYKSIMGDLVIKGKGIHKWDILVANLEDTVYIGICGFEEQFDKPGDKGFHGWALGSDGYVYNKKDWKWNDAKFTSGDVVNIVVNMNVKQCVFGVNNTFHYDSIGHSFPDEVYPFVSLKKGTKLRIQSCQI